MKTRNLLFILISVILLANCSTSVKKDTNNVKNELKNEGLTDEKIKNYIKAYNALRKNAPKILESLNQNNSLDNEKEQYTNFEQLIKDSGLSGYAQFVRLNAKIAMIFSIAQGTKGMERFADLTQSSDKMLTDNIAELQKQLQDPQIPEETKASLRQTIKELENASKELNENWTKNKGWADFVMDKMNKIANAIVNENEIDLVMKYENELLETYTGIDIVDYQEYYEQQSKMLNN